MTERSRKIELSNSIKITDNTIIKSWQVEYREQTTGTHLGLKGGFWGKKNAEELKAELHSDLIKY